MNVIEIFLSIDGEGIRAGELAVFIRLAGCNLRCSYCDTKYANTLDNSKEMTIKEIVSECKKYNVSNITLTGGEPLIHNDVDKLIDELTRNGFYVNIETNGSVDIEPYLSKNVLITMDYKTLSSGESSKMLISNISKLRDDDVLKIVMSKNDFETVSELLEKEKPKCYVYLSPIFGEIEPKSLVEFLKAYSFFANYKPKMRVQLQMHKYIWDANERGV